MKAKLLDWLEKKGINFFMSLVILTIIFGALFTFYSRYIIEEQQIKSKHAQKVLLDLKQLSTYIMLADVGVRGYMLVQEERFIAPFEFAKGSYLHTLNSIEQTLISQNYGELDSMQIIKEDMSAYMQLLDNMYDLAYKGENEAALSILYKDKGHSLMQNYGRFSNKINKYEEAVLKDTNIRAGLYIDLIGYIQWLLLILGLPTLLLVIFRIRRSERSRKALFKQLAISNKKYIFDSGTDELALNEESIIDSIIKNLRQASEFIKKITSGDHNVQWIGLDDNNRDLNKDNLAGELIQMREQMKKVKEEDNRRIWSTEGLSIAAEITRKYQHNTDELGNKLVTKVVQYLNANQAALFVLNDEDENHKQLDLIACYAYDRKKYLKKSIDIGEGLVGQAYLEADTIYLTEIPNDYVYITSGLGKATPSSILIIPLKYNEHVMGVLEIAAFQPFKKYQIEFAENLGEIIASTLSTVKTNEKTRILLEQSQEQAEEMRAQEEEMRQNMEELQATQEEMQRKTKEYEDVINEYQQKQDNNVTQ
ncbi:CHASE3 domain sensor protein/putative methionine-R-sulfoxide reductase with GAF domain [Catalinimonas alkaloidigena]|uniref:CHASE3 domain-containing protein n=1 Tax=Catalinimonas alkaloidigena TaxID=1075417 RepID=UPI00240556DF|nr:GAF domain-containing protein [Catalinimonas alkaloidigena]MDF9796162.1 CHASE3 domain sensor protein/putative methionine-R-sulfoxide reductase with GAF domain [Catalinimonas alkaloidigena]